MKMNFISIEFTKYLCYKLNLHKTLSFLKRNAGILMYPVSMIDETESKIMMDYWKLHNEDLTTSEIYKLYSSTE